MTPPPKLAWLFALLWIHGACAEVKTPPLVECAAGQVLSNGVCVGQPDGSVPDPLSVELTDGLLSYLDFDPDVTNYVVEVRYLLPELRLRVAPSAGVQLAWQSQSLALDGNGEAVLQFNPGASDLLRVTTDEGDEYRITIQRDVALEFEQSAYAKAPVAVPNEGFGAAVAASGDAVVVGGGADRVVIFRRAADAWARETEIEAPSGSVGEFGKSVAIDGDTVIVGALRAAYVYAYDGSVWTQEDTLAAANNDDAFGVAVGVAGDTAVVGSSSDSSKIPSSGAAFVFVRNGAQWPEQDVLKASNAGNGDSFGSSVAIDGDLIVVGARGEDSDSTGVDGSQTDSFETAADSGAAYVFSRDAGDWSQVAYLKSPETIRGGAFAWAVDVFGATVVVGAPGGDDGHGEAHVFSDSATSWRYEETLNSPNLGADDVFGQSVGIDRINIVIGAGGEDGSATGVRISSPGATYDDDLPDSGAAYVFVNDSGGWTPRFYTKARNADRSDYFGGRRGSLGNAVAISGDTVVVGAPGEDSNAIDVGGNGGDNSVPASGAAYIFR
jgi:uncharacterized membrane protein